MKISIKHLLITLPLLALSGICFTGEENSPEVSDWSELVSLKIECPRTVRQGEPVEITVTYENVSDRDLIIFKPWSLKNGLYLRCRFFADFLKPRNNSPLLKGSEEVILSPAGQGGSRQSSRISKRIVLGDFFSVDKPGAYVLQAEHRIEKNIRGQKFISQLVRSEPVRFFVLNKPPPEKKQASAKSVNDEFLSRKALLVVTGVAVIFLIMTAFTLRLLISRASQQKKHIEQPLETYVGSTVEEKPVEQPEEEKEKSRFRFSEHKKEIENDAKPDRPGDLLPRNKERKAPGKSRADETDPT